MMDNMLRFITPILFLFTLISIIALGFFISLVILRFFGIISNPYLFRGLALLGILMPIIMAGTMTLGGVIYHPINNFFNTLSGGWLTFVNFLFIASIGLSLVWLMVNKLGYTIPEQIIGYGILFIGIGVSIFSFYNASRYVVRHIPFSEHNLPESLYGKKIALVSDIHLGMIRKKSFLERITKSIMAEQPDMILIPGDLIDGPKIPYADFLSPLGTLSAADGIYFTPGNHEQYNKENALFYASIPSNVTTLIDATHIIPELGIQIVGIDYARESVEETKNRITRSGYTSEMPSITLLHDPKNMQAMSDAGMSFVVSGHTHGGQFFPASILVKLIYKQYTRGFAVTGTMPSFTTIGVGTALSPARLESRPEIIIFTIEKPMQ
ncbi:MAG: metallophosphoesterase [Candidatus Pacebacteria bacterium]|nr:metallophosphoesterase [Candidatus Paceibacterota bacterium]